ncbi:zinc-dependent metalloprotease [Chitinophaga sp. sic0106]|uniref:zinc-dependent metalloprotease n=1 Tax=Chitinophaga sp. sic0106 TaxID=2854785 RepID=UPI001C46EBB3|nr:zinc-dependent metalloprotease [Chitinophaga sp. sic0106]MBV7529651.1 zinc-dependent metalloprotease [Chitinophaga sp. sic0106]
MLKINIAVATLLAIGASAQAQKKTPPPADSSAKKTDTLPAAIKPYDQVITAKAKTYAGMFNVHYLNSRYYFEIPDSMLTRAILVVNRIGKAATNPRPNMTGYAGDQIAENVIHFDKGQDDKILLKVMRFQERSADTTENGMFRAVIKSNLEPIAAVFPVKAYNNAAHSTVIDVTDILNNENEIFHFGPQVKAALKIGATQTDKSFITGLKAFPMNIEIRTLRSYLSTGAQPGATIPDTYELNSSMVLLPKGPMQARYADARVGFFARGYVDFDADPQGVKARYLITRWRLEPKPEDVEKYKRGELVEPAQPIVYYIDPATPKKWVPYLIAGVNDWQKAFEQAGFKNAIKALPAPENDSTWSIDDARHSVIVYKPSSIANASGPHVHDPRSGEIIESHINWYHNIMQLVHNWYMVQAGPLDARARKMEFDDELMGQLIRFVSSHEVGHTLGLAHNFGSSSTVPVEKLRNKAWVEANGHTPSIMDYARFNWVAQPEDNIGEKGIFPRIGEYDRWAIQYGYRWYPQYKTPNEEAAFLNKLVIDSLAANQRLFFGSENAGSDPRSQSEDLGDNNVLAAKYGIKNLQRVLPQLSTWTRVPNEGYENLKTMYETVLRQYMLFGAQVMKSVGGGYQTFKSVEQPGVQLSPVPYQQQKEAMKFLQEYVFTTPMWLINDTLTALTGTDGANYISAGQFNVLMRLMGSGTIMTLTRDAALNRNIKTYSALEMLDDLRTSIWTELYNNKPIDVYRRNLQKMYVDQSKKAFKQVNEIVGRNNGNGTIFYINPDPTGNDASSLVRAQLVALRGDIRKAIPLQSGISKYHLQDMESRITVILSGKEQETK